MVPPNVVWLPVQVERIKKRGRSRKGEIESYSHASHASDPLELAVRVCVVLRCDVINCIHEQLYHS